MNETKKAPVYLVNRGKEHSKIPMNEPPPFGIVYVGGALKKAGFQVRIFHLLGPDDRPLLDAIKNEPPLFVGVSNFLSPNLKLDIELSRKLRGMGVQVVWGGIFSTCLPRVVLESDAVDYVVAGEGEVPVVPLAEAIDNGEVPAGIPGVGYRENGEVKIEPPEPPGLDLDRFQLGLELVDWSLYVHRDEQANTNTVQIPFSRGCPFRCTFCYNCMNPNRQKWRAHSEEYMRDMLSWLRKHYGVNSIYILSDNPFGKAAKAREIIEGMRTRWMTVAHTSVINADFIDWALSAGCHRLGLGLESGSDRILKMLDKKITRDEIRDKMIMCGEKKIFTHSSWMGFIPGETRDDLARTVSLMNDIHKGNKNHGFQFNVFRTYPLTPLWDKSIELGLVPPRTLDEWGAFRPQTNRIMGYSDRRAERLSTLMSLLFPFYRNLDRRLNSLSRGLLLRRASNGGFHFPVEESLRLLKKGLEYAGGRP
jgi:radical SAM superfamily enzyme YgiQ (UPF0313 family)